MNQSEPTGPAGPAAATAAAAAAAATGTAGTARTAGRAATWPAGQPPAARPRRGPAGWSLRTRLLALLLALLAAMSTVIVFVTALALRGVLIDQLDSRLVTANARWFGRILPMEPGLPPGQLPPPPGAGPEALGEGPRSAAAFLETRGQAPGTLGAVVRPDRTSGPTDPADPVAQTGSTGLAGLAGLAGPVEIEAAVIDAGVIREVAEADAARLADVPADGRPHTVEIGGEGTYRVLAQPAPNRQTVFVTGLPMSEVNATLTRMAVICAVVGALGVGVAGIAGAAIVRVTLRPLRRMAATASKVAELPLDRGEVALPADVLDVDTDPRTEVGQVGAALSRMLGHVGAALAARHASETRMRQFLADASHELRTPLAAISGYAELARRMGDAVPPDIAYAMRRVESESARMTALVSDLLLLARLDSGRPLVREPVDLSRLMVDAVSDAHVAAPQHRFELDLPSEPVTVLGDPARLHQVLANLLANARTHTPPGTRVVASLTVEKAAPARPTASAAASSFISLSPASASPASAGLADSGARSRRRTAKPLQRPDREPGTGGTATGEIPDGAGTVASAVAAGGGESFAVLTVLDEGPGIPAELLPKVFERFARGDSSRSRAAGSTGLGLSIVAAVVEAHRGRVEVTSQPGRTAFTVRLPLPSDEPILDDPPSATSLSGDSFANALPADEPSANEALADKAPSDEALAPTEPVSGEGAEPTSRKS